MSIVDDLHWFKQTFQATISAALAGSPFSVDLLTAIAAQETGQVWRPLRDTLPVDEVLQICVGDTLDADKGRKAFPKTKADLIAVPNGGQMFTIAHQALVAMAAHVPAFAAVAKRPDKFCHGFGIFQVDLQFFKVDPDYFLQQRWHRFDACLARCLQELKDAAKRAHLDGKPTLTDLEQVDVAIAYNAGSFTPSKGLKQGFFDGTLFYGERIFDLLRLSRTVPGPALAATIAAPAPGTAAIGPVAALTTTGPLLEVNVKDSPLRLHSEPKIQKAPGANVIAHLPDGHLVRQISSALVRGFAEVETQLHGGTFRGFAAAKSLVPVPDDAESFAIAPVPSQPASGVVAVLAPRTPGSITRRTGIAGAQSLNEPDQPGRSGQTPEELRNDLAAIVDYLAVDRVSHKRYQPRPGVTFCNIYAHDFCHLAGLYLPRVWWTPDAIEKLAGGQTVAPRLGSTIDEQRANDLFRWLNGFGPRFGWRRAGTLTELQTEVNVGCVGLVIARRKLEGRSGHIVIVVPETADERARRDNSGEVIAPLQSQAGASNFRYGTGTLRWWAAEQFADSAFWLHA